MTAVRDDRVGFMLVPQGLSSFRIPRKADRPTIVIVGDDFEAAHGPDGFHEPSMRRIIRSCAFFAVVSSVPTADIYGAIAGVATKAGVRLYRGGNEWKACCPFHQDRTPSFTIYADDRRAHCFGCGWSSDVLDFVQQAYGVKRREAIGMLDGGALAELEQQRAPAKPKADMRAVAQRIIDGSVAIEGTPAEAYLRSRGITMPLRA